MRLKVERIPNRLTKAATAGLLKWREPIARNAGGGHIEPAAVSRCARSTVGRRYHDTVDNARLPDIPNERFTAAAPIADHRLAFARLSIHLSF